MTADLTRNLETQTSNRHFRYHRLALAPLLAQNPLEALSTVKNSIQENERQPFLLFILKNGLGPLWQELLQQNSIQSFISPEFTRELRNITSHAASLYLFQKIALNKIDIILTRRAVPYAVFKGAHVREYIYRNPALRYACDIDILVAKTDKAAAIRALVEAGFAFQPEAKNISHEGSLTDGLISLDLHWDILRPGRTRIDVTDEFLAARMEGPGYLHLSNEAALFVMLVHPVFTKYTTTPQASLIRLVDLIRWTAGREIDWQQVADYLDLGGVQTAAWITATWLRMMTGVLLPEQFMQRIKPSPLKGRYLRMWLAKNLPTRLRNYPLLIQTGFTLPAHDTVADAVRFFRQIDREKKQALQKTEELLKSTNL